MSDGFCIECGRPFASIIAYIDDNGQEKYVHDACYHAYARRLLRPEGIRFLEDEPGFPGYDKLQQ